MGVQPKSNFICFAYFKCLVSIPQAKDMQVNYIKSKLPIGLLVLYNSLKEQLTEDVDPARG